MAGALRSAPSDEEELLGQPNRQTQHRRNPSGSFREREAGGAHSFTEIFWLHFGRRWSTSIETDQQGIDDYNARNTARSQKRDDKSPFARWCRRPAAYGRARRLSVGPALVRSGCRDRA